MNDKPVYRKWVGILLGINLCGSAHYLSGKRMAGIKWYTGIFACGSVGMAFVATPGTIPFILGVAFVLFSVALWFVMLKQSYRPVRRIGFLGWLWVIGLAVILNYGLKFCVRQFILPFKVPTCAMSPTIIPGDHLFAERLSYRFGRPKRGDIVVFRTNGITNLSPNTIYIKRIAGLPGDHIRIAPPNLLINDHKVTEPKIFTTISNESDGYSGFQHGGKLSSSKLECILKEDEYFVLGDNTKNSRDSRYWGAVPEENIIGKATRIYWPLTRINALRKKRPTNFRNKIDQ